ncbi:MAG: restriction endonuclease [Bacteroidota bacterium]
MPEITRRRTGELLRKLFQILLQHPDGMQARDALDALQSSIQMTDYERGTYASGSKRIEKIVRFATIDCVKAGWMLKHKGRWSITEEGQQAFTHLPDPEIFYRRAIKLYQEWRATQPVDDVSLTNGEEPGSEVVDEEKETRITFEEAEEQAWSEIEGYLRSMSPYDFQELVASLLRAMGYHISWISPPGKDGGIDILAWTDPLGTRPPRIKVQVKRLSNQNVTVEGLRSFMALLGDGDVGLFVTTSGFTKDAQEAARTQESRKVTLIDLERLFDLWVEYYPKLDDNARRRFPLQPIYFLAPTT